MQTIAIIDYGMGNLQSIKRVLDRLKVNAIITSDSVEILKADKIILPGVGHFGKAMENLKQLGLIESLNKAVLQNKTPILGICLGMQLMAKRSEEGNTEGLGWFDAKVIRFQIGQKLKFKVPHIGWNTVIKKKEGALLNGVDSQSEYYFVHAYHLVCENETDILGMTEYETPFVSAISKDRIYGVQFHPEKSHEMGELLIKNFVQINCQLAIDN